MNQFQTAYNLVQTEIVHLIKQYKGLEKLKPERIVKERFNETRIPYPDSGKTGQEQQGHSGLGQQYEGSHIIWPWTMKRYT